ncbi:MAG: hypothetical protein RJA81_2008 [Planctomycetota bacterium]
MGHHMLHWGTPAGIGIFLAGLGIFFWGLFAGVAALNRSKKP